MDTDRGYRWIRGAVRSEMVRQNLSYSDLAERLKAIGVEETVVNLRNKISRGKFSGLFLVQCLEVMGVKSLDLTMIADLNLPFEKPPRIVAKPKGYQTTDAFGDHLADEIESTDFDTEGGPE